MINEEQFLKDAITYLSTALASDGVLVMPKNQKRVPQIPCVTLTVASSPAVNGIEGELLASVRLHATVFARNVYAPSGSADGVNTIFDKLNAAMFAKHYTRSNQTEPYFNVQNNAWNKDGYWTKLTNQF